MRSVRGFAVILALGAMAVVANAQAVSAPLDALGSIRSTLAPFVPPATRLATLFIDGKQIDCQAAVPTKWLDVKEFRNASDTLIHKAPGLVHVSDLTIGGQVRNLGPLLSWFDQTTTPSATGFRKNLKLEIYQLDGTLEVAEFDLQRCWPRQVNYSPDDNDQVTIQIAVEGMATLIP